MLCYSERLCGDTKNHPPLRVLTLGSSMGLGYSSLSCPFPGPPSLTAPSFGAGTFQSHSSGAAADTSLCKAEIPQQVVGSSPGTNAQEA